MGLICKLASITDFSDRFRNAGILPASGNAAGTAAVRRPAVAIFCNPPQGATTFSSDILLTRNYDRRGRI